MRIPRPDLDSLRSGLRVPRPRMPQLRRGAGRRRGPQIDLPKPVADVYQDLKDAHMLPLVGLLVVAIAAVPFVFGRDKGGDVPPAPPPPSLSLEGPANLTVTTAPDPGLRDYRKRLLGPEKNPFRQQFTGATKSAQLTVADDGSGSGSAEVTVSESPSGEVKVTVDETPSGDTGGGGSKPDTAPIDPGKQTLRLFGLRPTVRFGKAGSGKLARHKNLAVGSVLPKKQGIVVFLGVTDDGKRALFDVSPRVVDVQGDANCIGGRTSCEILSLKAGQAVSLVGDPPLPTYRLNVEKINLVELDPPNTRRPQPSKREALGSAQFTKRFSK